MLLPFDFSDQCTAWLRVTSTDEKTVEATAGWSGVAGRSFLPSDFDSAAASLSDFAPIPKVTLNTGIDNLVLAVAKSRDELGATPSVPGE